MLQLQLVQQQLHPQQVLYLDADVFFRRILRNGNHLLNTLLPEKNSHGYNLRHRRHMIELLHLITTSETS